MASEQLLRISWLFLVAALSPAMVAEEISDVCVHCLCEAISGGKGCPATGSCHDGVCGPFAITFPYWQDAGRPNVTIGRNDYKTYEKCALDFTCSRLTIKGYMNRFHQDCDGDGKEDCWDYARIHYHGGYGCNKPLSVPARNVLLSCLRDSTQPTERPAYTPPKPTARPPYTPYEGDNNVSGPSTDPEIDIRFGD